MSRDPFAVAHAAARKADEKVLRARIAQECAVAVGNVLRDRPQPVHRVHALRTLAHIVGRELKETAGELVVVGLFGSIARQTVTNKRRDTSEEAEAVFGSAVRK